MKRQMKMTTAKKPQKKFVGGAMKKLMPKIKEVIKKNPDTVKAASPAAAAATSGGGRGVLGRIAKAVKKAGPAAGALAPRFAELTRDGVDRSPEAVAKSVEAKKAMESQGRRRLGGLKSLLKGKGKSLGAVSGLMGMKKGGAVMKDKMGRAMKKTTADAKGRAMKKGK